MKKHFKMTNILALYALICMLTTPSVLKAQFGIKAGLNTTNLSSDNLKEKGEKLGFHASAFVNTPLTADGFISLVPELSFSTQGTSFKPQNTRQRLNMNYVNFHLPVSFKLSNIDLQVGPYASYLASKPNYAIDDVVVVADAFKKFDTGLSAGLNYNFNKYFIGLRYIKGLVDVTNDNARLVLGAAKNSVGQVTIGYKF
jgi:hypothetical protein